MPIQETFSARETAAVVIIGGGVIGLSIARELALRGVGDIVLIERGGLGAEASYAAGGILGPQAEANCANEFFALACESRDLYPALAAALRQETGADIELDTTGTLYLAFSEHDEQEIERRYAWQSRAGLSVERLKAAEARLLEPGISHAVRSALRFPNDIQVENRRLLSALISSCDKHGVFIITNTSVESVRIAGRRVKGVETERGFLSAPTVVVASGSGTSLLAASGESQGRLSHVRIEPVRGQMVCFRAHPPLTRHVLYSARGYLVPRRDGRLLAGSTSEHAGFDKRVTARGIHSILRQSLEISPALGALAIIDSWAGLRPRAEDGFPVLGPCEIDGLVYATGHYRNGILLAPVTGKLIADAIITDVRSPLLSRFAPNRFAAAASVV